MVAFVEVPTNSLSSPMLDWAVAAAIELKMMHQESGGIAACDAYRYISAKDAANTDPDYQPSIDWNQGGPLLAELLESGKWEALQGQHPGEVILQNGSVRLSGSLLVATCRAVVTTAFGRAVNVQRELIGRSEMP